MTEAVKVLFGGDVSALEEKSKDAVTLIGSVEAAARAASAQMREQGQAAQAAGESWTSYAEKIAAFATATVAYLGSVGVAATLLGNQMRAAAGDFDLSTSEIGALEAIGRRTGVSITDMGTAFANLKTKAADGDAAVVKALQVMGLAAEDVADKTATELGAKLGGAFAQATDSAHKHAAGVALLGAAYNNLRTELDQGSAHMRDLAEQATRAGTAIGPELKAQLAGTSLELRHLGDATNELGLTFQGMLLQSFQQFKPAIDGLFRVFSDLVANVTQAVEWFFQLDAANQKAAQSTGLMTQAAESLVSAIGHGVAILETFAVRAYEDFAYVKQIAVNTFNDIGGFLTDIGEKFAHTIETVKTSWGAGFTGILQIAAAFGEDLAVLLAKVGKALFEAFYAAIQGVGQQFQDLGTVAKAALTFDWSGVKAGFSDMQTHAQGALSGIGSAFTQDLFANTAAAIAISSEKLKQIQADGDNAAARIQAQRKAQNDLMASGGAKAPQTQHLAVDDPAVDAAAKADKSAARSAEEALRTAITEATTAYDAQKSKLAELLAEHKISMAEWTVDTDSALEREAAAVKKAYDTILASAAITSDRKKMLMAEEAKKLEELSAQEAATNRKLVDEMQKQFEGFASTISGAFTSQFDKILQGTESWKTAMVNIVKDLSLKFINESISMTAKWIADQIAQAAASQAAAAAKEAASAAGAAGGLAESAASAVRAIMADAAQAFGGVFAFLSPVMGPAAAGPAAAAYGTVAGMAGAVASADIGMWQVPQDQLALVHHNELIMPAAQAGAFRSMLSGDAGGGGGSRSVNVSPSFHVHSMDSATVASTLQGNRGEIMKAISKAVRDGAHHGLKF